jgi:hypothetical protein
MTASYQIVYWRDIPAQVRVRSGRERVSRQLSERFQEAIDEAAMRDRMTATDDYLEEWRSTEWQAGEGEVDTLAERLAAQLESTYPQDRLDALVENKGRES